MLAVGKERNLRGQRRQNLTGEGQKEGEDVTAMVD